MVPIVGARSKRFEQFRGAIVVARIDPEEHAEPTFSRRDDVSRNHVDFRPRDLGEWRYRGSDLVRSLREKGGSGSISTCAALRPP